MAATISDIIEGQNARWTEEGVEVTRCFIVSGLSGNANQMLGEAVNTVGIAIGTAHPNTTYFGGCYAKEILPETISGQGKAAKVDIVYRSYDVSANYTYDLSGAATQETTNLYWDGSDYTNMELSYTLPADHPMRATHGKTTLETVHEGDYLQVRPKIRIARNESLSIAADSVGAGLPLSGQILINRQKAYIGMVNLAGWNIQPASAQGEWLCTDISATLIQYVYLTWYQWRVTYEFQWDADYWMHHAVIVDPLTNETPQDVAAAGDKWFDMYKAKNFSLLGLT